MSRSDSRDAILIESIASTSLMAKSISVVMDMLVSSVIIEGVGRSKAGLEGVTMNVVGGDNAFAIALSDIELVRKSIRR